MRPERGNGDNRKRKGALAEEVAAVMLQEKGYRVVDRNWRCRSGELDIVAETGGTLVFVEVRSRSGTAGFGTPSESVDARKILQVRNTAQHYIHAKRKYENPVRFDVISVMLGDEMSVTSIEHIPDAF